MVNTPKNIETVYDSENFTVIKKKSDDEVRFIAYSHTNDVSVYLNQDWRTGKWSADVNWASLGHKNVSEAREFTKTLTEAIDLAELLNTKVFSE